MSHIGGQQQETMALLWCFFTIFKVRMVLRTNPDRTINLRITVRDIVLTALPAALFAITVYSPLSSGLAGEMIRERTPSSFTTTRWQ